MKGGVTGGVTPGMTTGGVTTGGMTTGGVGVRGRALMFNGQFMPPRPVNSTKTGLPLLTYSTSTH
jgi:hypothetical protein